jgi:hypothetical protein
MERKLKDTNQAWTSQQLNVLQEDIDIACAFKQGLKEKDVNIITNDRKIHKKSTNS